MQIKPNDTLIKKLHITIFLLIWMLFIYIAKKLTLQDLLIYQYLTTVSLK